MLSTEDWWAVWLGLGLYGASLLTLADYDAVGWMVRPRAWEWTDVLNEFAWSKLLSASGTAYAAWHPLAAWLMTYAVFGVLLCSGARCLKLDIKRFAFGFTVLFVLTWICWIAGNELHLTMVDAAVDG
ncbi:MAG TPA: hypothetical protein VIM81_16450, partial [Gammaproteobacteria bacterium]